MPDLVIGSRRASPQRALRTTGLLVALVVTAFVVAWFIYRRSVAYEVPSGEPVASPIELEQTAGAGTRRVGAARRHGAPRSSRTRTSRAAALSTPKCAPTWRPRAS